MNRIGVLAIGVASVTARKIGMPVITLKSDKRLPQEFFALYDVNGVALQDKDGYDLLAR